MKPPSRLPLVVGLVLIAAGWAVIYVAWNKAATIDVETGQLPYIVSGGFGGLGLLLLGAAGVVLDVVLRTQWQSRRSIDELRGTLDTLSESLSARFRSVDQTDDSEPAPRRRRRKRTASAESAEPID